MKKFRLLVLLLAVSLTFASCNKDDDEVSLVSGNKYETTSTKKSLNGVVLEEVNTKAELEENGDYVVLEFKADGKIFADGVEDGIWAQSGSKVTFTWDGEDMEATINGDVLTITDTYSEGGLNYTYEVKLTKM